MNRHRIAAIAFVLISVAAVYSKSHEQQAQNPYNQMQSQFAQAGVTTRPSPSQADPYTQTLESSSRTDIATFSPVSYDPNPSRSDNYDTDDSGASKSRMAPAAPDVASWTRQTGGDHSAAVAMPPNWNLFQIAKGMAGVSGPNKEQVGAAFH